MILLGREWLAAASVVVDEHDVEVYWREPYWRWDCSCGRHLGYGNRREKIEAAAARHVREAMRQG